MGKQQTLRAVSSTGGVCDLSRVVFFPVGALKKERSYMQTAQWEPWVREAVDRVLYGRDTFAVRSNSGKDHSVSE